MAGWFAPNAMYEPQQPGSLDINPLARTFENDSNDWGNDPSLGCPYAGNNIPNDSNHFTETWKDSLLGRQVELMSHYCVNGSAAHLSLEEWNKLCFPTHNDAGGAGRVLAGVWALFNMIIGSFGNALTLVAIPYAKWKRRYEFHQNFYTTHIWVLHLAFCELIWCLFPLPVLFVVPYLGFRYAQGPGMDTAARAFFVIGHQTVYIDWLLLSIIVMTRAINLKYPHKWKVFCDNKIYVILSLIFPWVVSTFYILPHVIQPSLDFGYHCLFGYSTYLPTGEAPSPFLVENKWIVDLLPGIVAFFLPSGIIIISYILIWRHIKRIKGKQREIANVKMDADGTLSEIEIKFIWTVFIVCLCYVVAAGPLAFAKMFRELRTPTSMLFIISFMLCQYSLNFFIYAYRSKQYADAYWDVLILVFPCLPNLRDRWEKRGEKTTDPDPSNTTKEQKNDLSTTNTTKETSP